MRFDHGYTRYTVGCRCEVCLAAKRSYMRAARSRRLPADDSRHGTRNGYDNFGCRCPACTAAHSAAGKDYRERMRGASA